MHVNSQEWFKNPEELLDKNQSNLDGILDATRFSELMKWLIQSSDDLSLPGSYVAVSLVLSILY